MPYPRDLTIEEALQHLEQYLKNMQRPIEKRFFLHVPECATLTAIDFQQHQGQWTDPQPYQVGYAMIKTPNGVLSIRETDKCIGLSLADVLNDSKTSEINFIFDDKSPHVMALFYYLGTALEVAYKVKKQPSMVVKHFTSKGDRPAQAFINSKDFDILEQITIVIDRKNPSMNTILLAFCAE